MYKPEQVYVIGCRENELMKIGWSKDLSNRLRMLQQASPYELSVLCTAPGGPKLEKALHRAFSSRRVRGEWFDFTGLDPVTAIEQALGGNVVPPLGRLATDADAAAIMPTDRAQSGMGGLKPTSVRPRPKFFGGGPVF